MFIRFLTLLSLILPSALCASVNTDEPLTPFQQIVQIHKTKPFDFIGLAAEAAQLRADYSRVALTVMRSDELTLEQRLDFARNMNPDFDYFLQELLKLPNYYQDSLAELKMLSVRYDMPDLSGPFPTKEQWHLCSSMLDNLRNANLWSFIARSLRAYGAAGDKQSPDYAHRLLMELTKVAQYADSDVHNNRKSDGHTTNKFYIDEDQYARCILETVFLHTKLVLKFSDEQLPVARLVYLALNKIGEHQLGLDGLGSSFCLYYIDNSLSKRTNVDLDQTLLEAGKELIGPLAISNNEHIVEIDEELIRRGYYKDLVSPYLVDNFARCRLRQNAPSAVLNYIRDFTMTPECYSVTAYIDKVENELREKAKASFIQDLPQSRSRRAAQTKKRRQPVQQIKKQETDLANDHMPEPQPQAVVPLPAAQGPVAPRAKLPTSKQKLLLKKHAKAEAATKAMEPLLAKAAAKEEEYAHKIASIEIHFDESLCPSMKELELYSLLWGPDSGRKSMCWSSLESQLESFKWKITYSQGGSYVTLTPPKWFSKVRVCAAKDLNIHFRSSGFLLHHPHLVEQAPMPAYFMIFLREQLGNNIGLSDIVVRAMIKKLNEKANK